MKTRSFYRWAAMLSVCAIPALLLAQDDNPTGEAGVFNGTINTGGSYEAYTQNATRVVPDLPVVGAVGEIPLVFARIFNSRKQIQLPPSGFPEEACWWGESMRHLGDGGNWRHSYQWEVRTTVAMPSSPAGPARLLDPLFNGPDQNIRVHTPDGRELTFSASSTDTPYWRAGAGIPERLKLVGSTQKVAGTDHLIFKAADGSETKLLLTCYHEEEILDRGEAVIAIYYYRYYQPVSLTDRFGRVTTLAYDTSGRLVVTEPGGRWLRLAYTTFGGATRIDTVTSCYGQVVKMNYSSFGSGSWSVLSSVDYQFDPLPGVTPVTPKSAVYTYENPLSGASGTPVLKTADDPRFPGAMTKIKYLYQTSTGSGNGWLSEEQYTDGTMVSRIEKDATTGDRTETRGDGATRVFKYAGTRLHKYSNWRDLTELTELGYDANNYLSEVYSPILTRSATFMTREAITGKIRQVTRPDGSTVQYAYTSTTEPYFLDSTVAENGVTTKYWRLDASFPNMVSSIDYPDGSSEEFTYQSSTLKLPLTQKTRTGATKRFTFDDYSSSGPRSGVLQVPTAAQLWKGLLTKSWVTGVTGDSGGANLARWIYYDDNGRPVNLFGARGYREILDYDTADRVIQKTHDGNQHTGGDDFTDSSYCQFIYDDRGNLCHVRDELQTATSSDGRRTEYDDYRRPTVQTDPANRVTKFFYHPPGSPTVSPYRTTFATPGVIELPGHVPTTAPRLVWNEFTPDFWPYRRTTGADTTSDLAWEEFNYYPDGQLDETWNSYNGSLVPTTYKKKNIYDGTTGKLDRIYEMGNSSPQRQTIFTYAATTGWLEKTEYPDTKFTQITQWDVFGRPKKIKDERNNEIEKVFHVGGPLHKLIDSNGKEYVYLIDELGRTIETKYPVVGSGTAPYETVTFGLDGLATQMRNRNGQLTNPYFDHRGRATVIDVDSGVPIQGKRYLFEYDAASRPEELWTYTWSNKVPGWVVDTKISRDYGIDGSLEKERQWNSLDTVSREYIYAWSTGATGTGLLASLTLPTFSGTGGGTIAYGWTKRNMIQSVTGTGFGTGQPTSVSATFTYLPSAQLEKIDFGNGIRTAFAYDDADRVDVIHTHRPASSGVAYSNIAHRQYGYDARDRMQWFVHTGSFGQPWEDWRGDRYEYLDDGQLQHAWHEGVMVDYTTSPPTPTPGTIQAHGKSKFTYAFDPVGNRQSETYTGPSGTPSSPTTYTANARNEYTAVGSNTPGYGDGRGNLTAITVAGYNAQSFTHDAENRLVSATQNFVAKIDFTYDALGRCVHRLTTNLATSAIENQALYYDGGNVVEE